MKAIGYVRVSTDQQAESGLGLEAQRAAIATAALRLGLSLAQVRTDAGLSGSLDIEDRPGLLEAVADLRRGDVLLIAKRDRLGRDVIAVAMIERLIEKKGARIVSAAGEGTDSDSGDPTGILMRRIIDAFAEYERLLIGARTKAALRAKRARGERFSGQAPYGYRLSADRQRLEVDADEQQALAELARQRAAGRSWRAIADSLNRTGLVTRCGAPWRHQYVRNVLLRAGLLHTTERSCERQRCA
jgi:site-specific DNA recombinase